MPDQRIVVTIDCDTSEHAKDILDDAMADIMDHDEEQSELWSFPWSLEDISVLDDKYLISYASPNMAIMVKKEKHEDS